MKIKAILTVGAALLFAQNTFAATPTISGSYLLSITTFCSAIVDPWPSGSNVLIQGDYAIDTGIAKFDASASTVSGSFSGFTGSVVVPNATGGQLEPTLDKLKNQPYSNTATTFTLAGEQYQIVYGSVKSGISQEFSIFNTSTQNSTPAPTSPNCITRVTASHA